MQAILFDTTVYIAAHRRGDDNFLQTRNVLYAAPLWLSAVVLEELYAGADAAGRKRLKKMEHDFTRANRLLTPELSDWARTGQLLAQLGEKYGYEQIGRSRLTNDTLLAVSAARHGFVLVTANTRDFARIAEFCTLKWIVQ